MGGLDYQESNVGSAALCDFNISWAENAGVLTAISINVDAIDDDIGGFAERGSFGLTGGPLASDFILGGCSNTHASSPGSGRAIWPRCQSRCQRFLLITGLLWACLARLRAWGFRLQITYLQVMTILDLTEEETAGLARLLTNTIDADRYPLSPHIQTLKRILAKIQPEPVREPLPPLKHYEPPRATAARSRRAGR
jgi:hypothetical protein